MSARAFVLAAAVALAAGPVSEAQERLEFISKPVLVNCGDQACFRMDLMVVDASGNPLPIEPQVPMSVTEGGKEYPVFYKELLRPQGAAGQGATTRGPRRYTMLVVDTSGSMREMLRGSRQSKFDAAKAAIVENIIERFQEGTDYLAIVPFNSRQVRARIRAAKFTSSKSEAMRQLDDLGTLANNTALYTAISEALGVLTEEKERLKGDYQYSLVVFTDGKNDVNRPGDDPDLLGDEGLALVQKQAPAFGGQVITIGLGQPGVTFDESALRALKYPDNPSNYLNAADRDQLRRAFEVVRVRTEGRGLRLLVGPVRKSNDAVSGTSLVFEAQVGGLRAVSPRWESVPIGTQPWTSFLTEAETAAWIERQSVDKEPGGGEFLWRLVRRFGVLALYSALLAGLWFGLPRLIWPERYVPKPSARAASASPRAAGGGRPPAAPARGASQKQVTIHGRSVQKTDVFYGPQQAPPQGPAPEPRTPGVRSAPAPPPRPQPAGPRVREPAQPPPRPAPGPRDAGDATVFIPPKSSRGTGPDDDQS